MSAVDVGGRWKVKILKKEKFYLQESRGIKQDAKGFKSRVTGA